MSSGDGNCNNGKSPNFCIVLAEPEALELAEWVRNTVATHLTISTECTVLRDVGATSGDGGRFYTAALRALEELMKDNPVIEDSNNSNKSPSNNIICLIIAIFWDGQSETAKTEFIQLRKLTEKNKNNTNIYDNKNELNNMTILNSLWVSKAQFITQTLGAKKCTHMIKENSDALVKSLWKKLSFNNEIQRYDNHNVRKVEMNTQQQQQQQMTTASSSSSSPYMSTTSEGKGTISNVEDLSETAIREAIENGQGECFIVISGHTMEEFQQCVEQLHISTKNINAGCIPLITEPREMQVSNHRHNSININNKTKVIAQEFLLRQGELQNNIELRIAMCGNVDSGKSTLTSVLTRGCRDDGRGFARTYVFKHKHELTSGRTSSISENHLGFSSTGEVINDTIKRHHHLNNNNNNNISNVQLTQMIVTQSSKIITLYDLAGHEKYLKTTVLGMTRNMPDYSCVVISANNGIQRMTKEHIALCLALKIPFFIVLTRIDSTPENIKQETLEHIYKLLKIPTIRKLPYLIHCKDDIIISVKNLRNNRITPIFEISNVTGKGIDNLLCFLNFLPIRKDWRKARLMPREMIIDNTFFITGVGTVVGGIITQGIFHVNDNVLLGPDMYGNYRSVHIKSIHVKGREQQEAIAGFDAAFCLKKEKRHMIRKGNILTDPNIPSVAYWQFEADITILYHSTTIVVNYEPVIHCTTVRQSARIVYVAKEILRTGDRSLVRFHFLYRPEFMKIGQQLIFREGRTKGIGTVTNVIIAPDDSIHMKKRRQKR